MKKLNEPVPLSTTANSANGQLNVVREWSDLDADIARLIGLSDVTPGYRKRRTRSLKRFDEFVRERGYANGLGAPFPAYLALVAAAHRGWLLETERPEKGRKSKPWTANYLRSFVSALRVEHQEAGLVIAVDQAKHVGEWNDTINGYARTNEVAEQRTKHTVPMSRSDVAAMIATTLHSGVRQRALAVCSFLAADFGVTWDELRGVSPISVNSAKSGVGVTLTTRTLIVPHAHVEFVETLDPICSACVVQKWADHPDAADVALDVSRTDAVGASRRRWILWAKRQGELRPDILVTGDAESLRVAWRSDMNSDRLGIARFGLWSATDEALPRLLASQARLALSWSFGLRGGNEPAELKRSDVKVEPGPKLRFHLDKSKADQDRIGADFGMTADTEGKRALLRAVVRWVAVWDSCQPDPAFDGPLFCTFTSRNGGDPRLSKSRQMTSNRADFRRLAVLAGLEPNWTPHSTRAGYAVTAVDDGHSLTTVSRAMRHSNVRTTETYLAHAGDQGHAAVRSIFRPGNHEPKEAN